MQRPPNPMQDRSSYAVLPTEGKGSPSRPHFEGEVAVELKDVMVVDDSPTMRTLVGFALGKYWACEVRHAGNGIEAIDALDRKCPDLMVVDINMPKMDGLELISTIRARTDGVVDVPIVVLTTEGSDDDIRRGMQAGATAYLGKPFQPQKLHTIIDRLLAGTPS